MIMEIPKIIHQIWSDVQMPLPDAFRQLGETWKRDYPDWEYILWDDQMMNDFIHTHYPQHVTSYESFPYNVQRWDVIRYLIMDKIGGMYVDCDFESIEPIDELVVDKTCCFAIEPDTHRHVLREGTDNTIFSNAMMLCSPGHFFIKRLIDSVMNGYSNQFLENKWLHVLTTTGPYRIVDLYHELLPEEKDSIYLIPAKYVMPFDFGQAQRFRHGEMSDELEKCLEEAYAVHYFLGQWTGDGA
jgi:mannosyltransferase OCH1-like enzyme